MLLLVVVCRLNRSVGVIRGVGWEVIANFCLVGKVLIMLKCKICFFPFSIADFIRKNRCIIYLLMRVPGFLEPPSPFGL